MTFLCRKRTGDHTERMLWMRELLAELFWILLRGKKPCPMTYTTNSRIAAANASKRITSANNSHPPSSARCDVQNITSDVTKSSTLTKVVMR